MSDDTKREGGPTWRMRWIIHPKVRNTFLALSGVVLFLLGALVLKTRQERVDFDLRLYRWPSKLNAGASSFRAQAVHASQKNAATVHLCSSDSITTSPPLPVPKGAKAVETVLDLLGDANTREYSICLEVKGWGQRTFAVQRPPTRTARELQATWGWFEAQSVSYVAHPSFPFDLLAVPEGGSFNPKKPQQNLLVRVQPQGADRPLSKIKSGLGDHEPRPDGSFDVPLKKTPLGAVVVLSVTDDAGQTHETTLRFSMSARDFEISVVRAKNKIDVLVTSLLSSGLEDDGSAIPVFCSLFMGDAVLATRQGWLPAPKEQSEISFELDQAALKELVAVGCDSSPLFSALDSASLWAFPEAKPDPNAPWLEALYKGLEDRVGAKVAGQFRDDLLGEDEVARARARRFINQLLPPKAPGMAFVAGSYVDDQRALHKKYRMRRLALMITLVIVLLTWLYMTLYALKINRSERLSALDFLDDGTAQGLEESQRAELFSRPKSGMLATSVVLVMILSMVGLLWVLFWL